MSEECMSCRTQPALGPLQAEEGANPYYAWLNALVARTAPEAPRQAQPTPAEQKIGEQRAKNRQRAKTTNTYNAHMPTRAHETERLWNLIEFKRERDMGNKIEFKERSEHISCHKNQKVAPPCCWNRSMLQGGLAHTTRAEMIACMTFCERSDTQNM